MTIKYCQRPVLRSAHRRWTDFLQKPLPRPIRPIKHPSVRPGRLGRRLYPLLKQLRDIHRRPRPLRP